jgi:YjbE family integral membrane protein
MVSAILTLDLLPELTAAAQVILIDIVLAGDNAIVVGMAAAGVAREQRIKVIFWGMVAAVALRIVFSMITMKMLGVVGLTLAGGILLLWVCWKLFRETWQTQKQVHGAHLAAGDDDDDTHASLPKSMHAAIGQIAVADVSMSLDNVLAVAGAARDHPIALIFGLLLSVALMGVASSVIAPLFQRWPRLAYVGVAIILYVALEMIWRGSGEVLMTVL